MSDSQSYAAIMSHDVDIVQFIGLVLSPVAMFSKAVVFGNQNVEKCHNITLLFNQFQNQSISVILCETFD